MAFVVFHGIYIQNAQHLEQYVINIGRDRVGYVKYSIAAGTSTDPNDQETMVTVTSAPALGSLRKAIVKIFVKGVEVSAMRVSFIQSVSQVPLLDHSLFTGSCFHDVCVCFSLTDTHTDI